MLLGPIFRAELVRTARRRRYYALRVAYASALLVLIYVSYLGLYRVMMMRFGRPLISEVAGFALKTFMAFAALQLVTIVGLVPALFGGVIADEKQRKTMHYLMASQLSSGEIVLDKLLARLLHVGVFFLLGMPVMSLLNLFGGVTWEYVAAAYAGTASITLFAATLSTLVSTLARRVRQGVLIAYLLLVGWLVIPPAVGVFLLLVFPAVDYPAVNAWLGPIIAWAVATSPLSVAWGYGMGPIEYAVRGGPAALLITFLWMVGLQLALSALFLLLAIWQLRPTFRRQEGGSRRLTWFRASRHRPRWLERPECGDDAMLWKERHFARTDILTKLVVLPATILLTVALALSGAFDELVVQSAQEVWRSGYSGPSFAREALNQRLRMVTPFFLGLWLLAVAGASASSLTVEREEDSWISLVSTPLTGWEILRGKLVGAVWGLRGFGGLLSLIWLISTVLGAVHPIGLLLSLFVVAILTGSVAALGVHWSLGAKSTSRALTKTLVTLIVLNGGYLVVVKPVLDASLIPVPRMYMSIGCTPWTASLALISYGDVAAVGKIMRGTQIVHPVWWNFLFGACLVVAAYGMTGLFLLKRDALRFDEVVDRPRRGPLPPHLAPLSPINRRPAGATIDPPVHSA